ncbi:MAG: outer membrane protein assembly factor BamE [Pseudomonadota bacterium]
MFPPILKRLPAVVATLSLSLTLGLSGCATKTPSSETASADGAQTTSQTGVKRVLWLFSPFRIDIQQGNFVSEEMVSQLKEGMTRDQVRFVLGTPLLTDIFHGDRWDYPFRLQKSNGDVITSRVAVFFKDGKMERFEGGNLPSEKDYLARIAGSSTGSK